MLPRPSLPRAVQSGSWQNWASGSIGISHEARFGDHAWRNAWWTRAFQGVTPLFTIQWGATLLYSTTKNLSNGLDPNCGPIRILCFRTSDLLGLFPCRTP